MELYTYVHRSPWLPWQADLRPRSFFDMSSRVFVAMFDFDLPFIHQGVQTLRWR